MSDPAQSPANGDTVIAASGLVKVFKDFWGRPKARAVDGVDLNIKRGEVFGLLGPNGSGKSTTIKLLLGLLRPSAGHIEVFGRAPDDVATKERIGYLPEESYLYRYFTPGETLNFFGKLFDLPASERRARSAQLIEMVGLQAAQDRTVGEFSKGMQRRIGLAQALINDPDLVILDEPTAGLDPIGCREVKDVISALARRGKTVILSSHLLADVEDVCDRVVIYYGGKVQAHGPLGELLANPDAVQLTLPALPSDVMKRLLTILRDDFELNDVQTGVPTQNLERYFLNVVEQARSAAAETSGASGGNQVAEYLRADEEPKPESGERLLERLQQSAPPETAQKSPTEPPKPKPATSEKLKELSDPTPASAPTPAPAESDEKPKKKSDEKLNARLANLMSKPPEE